MPFLGVQPTDTFSAVAKQTITGDGSTTYTLTHSVASANDLAVFVNNVRQEPTTAYSASGTSITFTEAIASTDSCYVVYIGRTFQTLLPPDNSVNEDQISYPLTNFRSTGIDDNSDALAMTISADEDISIGSASSHAGARVTINDTPPTAFGSPMLQVGQETFTASGYYSIGLGYTAGSYTKPPAEIAAVATSSSGGTTADIVFGTRSVTTNTAVTERMRIRSSGGITFNGDTAAANALDDYEEGTWTPTMLGYGQTLPATQTYSSQVGHYVKIGRLVVASYKVTLSNKGNMSGNYVLLAGWPFGRESANFDCGIAYFNGMSTSVNSMWWELTNSSYGWLAYIQTSGNTASSYMTTSGIGNSTQIQGSVAYLTP